MNTTQSGVDTATPRYKQAWHAAIWPNGDWCWRDALDAYLTWRSDDFIRVAIPEWMGCEALDFFAEKVRFNGWTIRDIELAILRDIDGPEARLPDNWTPPNYV